MKTHLKFLVKIVSVRNIVLCSLLFSFSCTKEKEYVEYNYVRVETELATNINSDGVTFNGSFLNTGKSEIIDHGFLFSKYDIQNIQYSEKISLGASNGIGSFNATAKTGMVAGTKYYVSAYAQDKNIVFYAKPVSFISLTTQ